MEAAAPRPSPLEALRRALPGLPDRLRAAGRFVAEHEYDAATRSMRELAGTAGLQPASFTRLAQALGHAGWEEFRAELVEAKRPELAGRFSSRARSRPQRRTRRSECLDTVADALDVDARGLAAIDAGEITRASEVLHSAARIWVAGFRSCRSVAVLLHYQLRLFRPDDVRLVGGTGPEDCDFGAFRSDDALVLVGFAPYSRASVLTRAAANAAGCRLIALADAPCAPICDGADHVLLFDAAATPAFFPSLTGAMALAQGLAAAVYLRGGKRSAERLCQSEARLKALSQYVAETDGGR
jgi:DNA-binding MurR/RpiR family transcriptional regulator